MTIAYGLGLSQSANLAYNIGAQSGIVTPLDFSPLLWLDATDPAGNGILPTTGSSLASWVDKSGNGNTFTQGTGALQPIFNTNVQNGLPAVAWNGSKSMSRAIAKFTGNPSFSIFSVIQCTSLGANHIYFGAGSGNGAYESYGSGYNFGFGQAYSAFEWGGQEVLYGPIVGNFDQVSIVRSNVTNESELWANNIIFNDQNSTPGPLNLNTNCTLGRHSNMFPIGWVGNICELVILPYTASTNQRIAIQNIQKAKWGTP